MRLQLPVRLDDRVFTTVVDLFDAVIMLGDTKGALFGPDLDNDSEYDIHISKLPGPSSYIGAPASVYFPQHTTISKAGAITYMYGSCTLDFDQDGLLDVIFSDANDVFLVRNRGSIDSAVQFDNPVRLAHLPRLEPLSGLYQMSTMTASMI
jgi:hypothetical protein